jgi:hypothetical protein
VATAKSILHIRDYLIVSLISQEEWKEVATTVYGVPDVEHVGKSIQVQDCRWKLSKNSGTGEVRLPRAMESLRLRVYSR